MPASRSSPSDGEIIINDKYHETTPPKSIIPQDNDNCDDDVDVLEKLEEDLHLVLTAADFRELSLVVGASIIGPVVEKYNNNIIEGGQEELSPQDAFRACSHLLTPKPLIYPSHSSEEPRRRIIDIFNNKTSLIDFDLIHKIIASPSSSGSRSSDNIGDRCVELINNNKILLDNITVNDNNNIEYIINNRVPHYYYYDDDDDDYYGITSNRSTSNSKRSKRSKLSNRKSKKIKKNKHKKNNKNIINNKSGKDTTSNNNSNHMRHHQHQHQHQQYGDDDDYTNDDTGYHSIKHTIKLLLETNNSIISSRRRRRSNDCINLNTVELSNDNILNKRKIDDITTIDKNDNNELKRKRG